MAITLGPYCARKCLKRTTYDFSAELGQGCTTRGKLSVVNLNNKCTNLECFSVSQVAIQFLSIRDAMQYKETNHKTVYFELFDIQIPEIIFM